MTTLTQKFAQQAIRIDSADSLLGIILMFLTSGKKKAEMGELIELYADEYCELATKINKFRKNQYFSKFIDDESLSQEEERIENLWRVKRQLNHAKVVAESKANGECPKCKGTGHLPHYSYYANGECFRCKGTGKY